MSTIIPFWYRHHDIIPSGGILVALLVIVNVAAATTTTRYTPPVEKQAAAYIPGDFVIGALLPLHLQPPSKHKKKQHLSNNFIQCGEIRESYGIQRAEVAFYTLDKINSDENLLPNITLGMEIRDECWYAPVALQQSIELVRDSLSPPMGSDQSSCIQPDDSTQNDTATANGNLNTTPAGEKSRGPVIGVLGPGSSSVALQVQNLLQLFHMPQMGYSTTSKDLSDKSRFNYFLRVVPSDYHQAQVMLDIVQHYGWTYVSVVNTDENYGQSGMQAFRELSEKANVCIARESSVLSNAPDEVFDKVILNLKQDHNALVVVCFCEGFTIRGLLSATRRLNMTNHFLFIGSDGWGDRGDVINGYEREAWGSISIRLHSPPVPNFESYYLALKPRTNLRNPWFQEFWETRFNCRYRSDKQELRPVFFQVETQEENRKRGGLGVLETTNHSWVSGDVNRICTGEENLGDPPYKLDSKLSFVIKAIYSFAYGLHSMQQAVCGINTTGVCDKLFPFNGSLFKNHLLNVSFTYGGDLVEFDESGDPPGRYDILNYQQFENGRYDYVQIGDWNNSLKWRSKVQLGPNNSIKSVCSQPCMLGHYKNVQKGGKDKRCCWVCVQCPAGEYITDNSESQKCEKCPLGHTTNNEQTRCFPLPIEFTQWTNKESIVAISFAIIGISTTWFSFIIFIRYHNTPVVKSSTKELSYIILAGMTLSHASIFPILAKPTVISCTLARFLPGLSFAMIYAALLTKTNRIARILAGSKKTFPTKKRLFMTSTSQVIITIILIGVQTFVSILTLYYQRPDVAARYLSNRTVLECNTSAEGIMITLACDFILILLCTVYALKTRNVPENFNEAKFIGFAMYTACVIWIAFVPIYFGGDSKVLTMCMCVTLSAQVTWLFLFVPKLYIIIFRPERNNRSFFTTTSKSIRCHIGARVSSALSEKSSVTSWRESTGGCETCSDYKPPLALPASQNTPAVPLKKRSLSCQTGVDLMQMLLLDPKLLLAMNSNCHSTMAQITERDCCQTDSCELKKITIRLPEQR